MEMKLIDLLDATTESISACTTTRRLLADLHIDHQANAALTSDQWMTMCYAMDTSLKLFTMLPDTFKDRQDESVKTAQGEMYMHKHQLEREDGDAKLHDLNSLSNTLTVMHSYAHDLYSDAREAIKLYT